MDEHLIVDPDVFCSETGGNGNGGIQAHRLPPPPSSSSIALTPEQFRAAAALLGMTLSRPESVRVFRWLGHVTSIREEGPFAGGGHGSGDVTVLEDDNYDRDSDDEEDDDRAAASSPATAAAVFGAGGGIREEEGGDQVDDEMMMLLRRAGISERDAARAGIGPSSRRARRSRGDDDDDDDGGVAASPLVAAKEDEIAWPLPLRLLVHATTRNPAHERSSSGVVVRGKGVPLSHSTGTSLSASAAAGEVRALYRHCRSAVAAPSRGDLSEAVKRSATLPDAELVLEHAHGYTGTGSVAPCLSLIHI